MPERKSSGSVPGGLQNPNIADSASRPNVRDNDPPSSATLPTVSGTAGGGGLHPDLIGQTYLPARGDGKAESQLEQPASEQPNPGAATGIQGAKTIKATYAEGKNLGSRAMRKR